LIKQFKKIQTALFDLMQVQTNVSYVLDPLVKVPFLDGAVMSQVTLASGSNRIAQPLQRRPLGWFITDRNSAATVYRTAWDSNTITLTASAATTVDIWVY
jgi:hypothetical protein